MHGAEAVSLKVMRRGCLGLCERAPNAVIRAPPKKPVVVSNLRTMADVVSCVGRSVGAGGEASSGASTGSNPEDSLWPPLLLEAVEWHWRAAANAARHEHARALDAALESLSALDKLDKFDGSFGGDQPGGGGYPPRPPRPSPIEAAPPLVPASGSTDGGGQTLSSPSPCAARLRPILLVAQGRALLHLKRPVEALAVAEAAAAPQVVGGQVLHAALLRADALLALVPAAPSSPLEAAPSSAVCQDCGEDHALVRERRRDGATVDEALAAYREVLAQVEALRAAGAPRKMRLPLEETRRVRATVENIALRVAV